MTTNSNSNTSSSVGSTSSSTHPGAAVVSFGTSPEPPVRRGRPSTTTTTTAKTHYDDKSPVGGTSDASRELSNPAKVAYCTTGSNNNNSKKSLGPANNRSIHDFFSSSHKRTTAPGGGSAGGSGMDGNPLPSTTSHEEGKPDASSAATRNTSNLVGDVDQIDWAAKFQKLEQLLQDKEEQLKAVTNNKTILHTALQSALEKTKHELEAVKSRMNDKTTAMGTVLEDLLRWKSNQQAKDLRETLATDGARLGRIVYARAGMRALESWEEGYATRDLEHRKLALVAKREALEERSKQVEAMENRNTFEGMEAREAIRMHFENLRTQEADLSKDEESLNDEKGAHIRALKRVASEDASRFRHRPKVRTGRHQCQHPIPIYSCFGTYIFFLVVSCMTDTFCIAYLEREDSQKCGELTTWSNCEKLPSRSISSIHDGPTQRKKTTPNTCHESTRFIEMFDMLGLSACMMSLKLTTIRLLPSWNVARERISIHSSNRNGDCQNDKPGHCSCKFYRE